MREIYHALALEMHQPSGNLEYLLDTDEWEAKQILFAYERMPRVLRQYEDLARVNLVISGTLLEALSSPEFQRRVYGIVDCGSLLWVLQNTRLFDVLGTAYYHPLLALIPEADWDEQIRRGLDIARHLFWRPQFGGFWPPDMGFDIRLIPPLRRAGYRYVLVDSEYVRPVDPMSWQEIRYRPHIAEYEGEEIIVIVRDRDLSAAQLAGMDHDWFHNELEERTKGCDFPPLVTTATAAENGGWFRNVDEEANFWTQFYRNALEQIRAGRSAMRPTFITAYLDRFGVHGRVTVERGAWETGEHHGWDYTQWQGSQAQREAMARVHDVSREFHWFAGEARSARPTAELSRLLSEAHWHLLRAEASDNFFWGGAWLSKAHRDLDDTLWHLGEARSIVGPLPSRDGENRGFRSEVLDVESEAGFARATFAGVSGGSRAVELFKLSRTTPDGFPIHGELILLGTAEAAADFRRGIDLSAGFDFRGEGQLEARIADILNTAFRAGASLQGGLALQVAFPLDIFTEAGLIGRFRAQVAASAFVGLTISLEFEEFYQRLQPRLPAGPFQTLLGIFSEEMNIQAGVWARAAFSAEIVGQASLTGSLNPTAVGGAGFTFALQYAVGLLYGTGYQFTTNFGIENPQSLADRLSSMIGDLVVAEAERYVTSLAEPEASVARPALAAIRIVAPLAARVPFQVGFDLARNRGGQASGTAALSVVEAALRAAQEQILRSAIDLATAQLGDLFGNSLDISALLARPEEEIQRILDQLTAFRDQLERLTPISVADVEEWLPTFLTAIDNAEIVFSLGIVAEEVIDEFREPLAFLWVAGQLVGRVMAWSGDPNRVLGEIFGPTAVAAPSGGFIGSFVIRRLNKELGSGLTFVDLIDFIFAIDAQESLRTFSAGVADLFAWLSQILGIAPADLLQRLFRELTSIDENSAREIVSLLVETLGRTVREQVIPQLIVSMRDASRGNEAIVVFINELVEPCLVALPDVFLPRIADLDSSQNALRFREALSAIALQSLLRFVVTSVDVLLEHAMREGEVFLPNLADDVRQLGERHPAYSVLAGTAAHALLPWAPTLSEVADILNLSGRALGVLKEDPRAGLIEAVRLVIALGLQTEDTRQLTLTALATSDRAPVPAQLERALERVTGGLWIVTGLAIPEILRLVLSHPVRKIEEYGRLLIQGIRAVIPAVIEAAQWIANRLSELETLILRAAADITQALRRFDGWISNISNICIAAIDGFFDNLRDRAWAIIEPFIPGFLRGAARGVLNGIFDFISTVLTAPLVVLREISHWIRQIIESTLTLGVSAPWRIQQLLENRIRNSAMPHLHFHFRIEADTPLGRITLLDLGTISIVADTIIDTIIGMLIRNPLYQGRLDAAISEYQSMVSLRAQKATLEAERNSVREESSRVPIERLLPRQPIAVGISSPGDGTTASGSQSLLLSIRGVNRTFLEETLGVPRRISLFLNGRPLPQEFYARGWLDQMEPDPRPVPPGFPSNPWVQSLIYSARMVPVFVPPADEPNISTLRFSPLATEARFEMEAPLDLSVRQPHGGTSLIVESTARGFAAEDRTFVLEQLASENPPAAARLRRMRPSLVRQGLLDANEDAALPLVLTGTVRIPSAAAASALISATSEGVEAVVGLEAESASAPLGNPNPGHRGPPLLFGQAGLNTIAVVVTDGQDQLLTETRSFFIGPAESHWSAWQPLGSHAVDGAELAVAENADGRLEVFVCGTDGSLWHIWQRPAVDGWSNWRFAGNQRFTGRSVVVSNADGHFDLFIRSLNGSLWQMWQLAPNGGWSNWVDLGAAAGTPVVAENADGRLELFVRGYDYATWQRWQRAPNNGWSAWRSMGGYYQRDPVVAKNADGRLEVFNRDALGGLWQIWQVAPNYGWVEDWLSAESYFYLTSPPVVDRHGDGRLIVFGRGEDTALWHRSQTAPNDGWTGWSSAGGNLAGDPVVAHNADGRLEVFVRGVDGSMSHIAQRAPNGPWSGWLTVTRDFDLAGDPVVTESADGRLSLFVRGTDGALWHMEQMLVGGAWSRWHQIGEDLTADPVIGRNVDGRLEVFAIAKNSHQVHHSWQE